MIIIIDHHGLNCFPHRFNFREYVQEVKVRLVKYLTSCPLSPRHAREFFTMLLEEYQAYSRAFAIMKPFFSKLVRLS